MKVPKGTGARTPLRLRDWQRDLVASVLDADPQPRTAGWMLPRGQGKSSLVAAWGLYELLLGGEGATVCVVAVNERQAGIVFGIARRMVELDDELAARCQVFKERLVIPARDAQFHCLPAEPKRLEGLDYTLAILDEAGVANRDSYEVLTLAQGKRERSTLVAIGTPGPNLEDQVLLDLRAYAAEHPDDRSLVWREFSAAGFEDHPADCAHCWELANPALDDFLHRDALHALLPPKTRESTFRRARLCQLATDTEGQFLPGDVWAGLATGKGVPDRAEVVIALDGSFSDDTTALLVGTVSPEPHFDVIRVWERPDRNDAEYRVPVAEVEDTIRASCRRWQRRGDHRRPIQVDPHPASPGSRAAARRRVPAQPFTFDRRDHRLAQRRRQRANEPQWRREARRPRWRRGDRRGRPRDAPVEAVPVTYRPQDRPGRLPGHGPLACHLARYT